MLAEAEPEAKPDRGPKRDTPTPEPTPTSTPEDLAPHADAGGPYEVAEGDRVRLDGRGSSDPDGTIVAFAWSREGRLDDPAVARPRFGALDDGELDIDLTVGDDDGVSATATALIRVRNVDPLLEVLAPLRVTGGERFELELAVSDAGVKDTHTLDIDWGDGTTETPPLEQGEGTAQALAAHTYETAGEFGRARSGMSLTVTPVVPPETELPPETNGHQRRSRLSRTHPGRRTSGEPHSIKRLGDPVAIYTPLP